jgi:hypothetical protein
MATRSIIAKKVGSEWKTIYAHWDGYPQHNGKILLQHYTDENKVDELIANGDLSILAEEIGEAHDFDSRQEEHKNWCKFYGRDRGESGVDHRTLIGGKSTIEKEAERYGVEFVYVFENNTWSFSSINLIDGNFVCGNFSELTLDDCN